MACFSLREGPIKFRECGGVWTKVNGGGLVRRNEATKRHSSHFNSFFWRPTPLVESINDCSDIITFGRARLRGPIHGINWLWGGKNGCRGYGDFVWASGARSSEAVMDGMAQKESW